MTTVAIVAVGHMGAAIGRRLVDGGAVVLTSLEGRSAASEERARQCGLRIATDDAELASCDIFLSIVPPAVSRELAERFIPHLSAADTPALYVDCNAIAPATVRGLGETFAARDLPFADAAIIGRTDGLSSLPPRLYMSGDAKGAGEALQAAGLDCRLLSGPVGAASELKMTYSALTKGFQALGALIAFSADEPDLRDRLVAELQLSQPALFGWLRGRLPDIYQKAYRWEQEMAEIATFLSERHLDPRIFESAAALFRELDRNDEQIGKIDRFVGR